MLRKSLDRTDENFSENYCMSSPVFVDECTVTALCENHPETLCSVCIKLDDKRSIKNWRHLAIEIGVNESTLRRLRDPSGYSPSEAVLTKIQTLKPRLSLKKLTEDINLPGVTKLLDNFLGSTFNDVV